MEYLLFPKVEITFREHCIYKGFWEDFRHFSSFSIDFSFVFTTFSQCFSGTSKDQVFLMEYLLFSKVEITSRKHCKYKANFNDFQHFSSFSIYFTFVFTTFSQCFFGTSKYQVFLMEYLLFSKVEITSRKHRKYKAEFNAFQHFSSFSGYRLINPVSRWYVTTAQYARIIFADANCE